MEGAVISVIVPIYKVEAYLERCVHSICNQTYRNMEIILVDDGSPDNCCDICEKFKNVDSRIKVIHKTNGGLSDARNAGINVAIGDYILFIDSDDYIEATMVEELYASICRENSDIAICGFDYVFDDGTKTSNDFYCENEKTTGYQATKRLLEKLEPEMVVAWNKLEKRTLWCNREFPVGKQHEDDFTTYQLMFEAKTVSYVNKPLYHYFQRKDSIVGSGFSQKSTHKIEAYISAMGYFYGKDDAFYNRCCNIVLIMNRRCCEEAIASELPDRNEIVKELKVQGRRFYLRNFMHIKRSLLYHVRMIWYYFI